MPLYVHTARRKRTLHLPLHLCMPSHSNDALRAACVHLPLPMPLCTPHLLVSPCITHGKTYTSNTVRAACVAFHYLLSACMLLCHYPSTRERERERKGERCGCTGRMRERHIQSEQSICMYIHTYVARKEKENKRHRARQCPRKGYPRPGTPGGERHPCAGIAGHNRWFLKTYGNFIRQGAPGGGDGRLPQRGAAERP